MYNIKGIDISKWQNPKTYPYAQAKAEGFSFAIIRAGCGSNKDTAFESHYKNCKNNGLQVGAYWYSYALSTTQAEAEAKAFIEALKGKQFEYPVYLDIEDKSILKNTSKATRNAIVSTFGNTLENVGYYFGVYTNRAWFDAYISGKDLNKKYDWWIADWRGRQPQGLNFGLWQYGGSKNPLRNSTIGGVVTDQNFALKDYPTLIKKVGLNGFSNGGSTSTPAPPTRKTTEQLVSEVIAGKWSNGAERQKKLTAAGYNYVEIQRAVNRKLGVKAPIGIGDRVKIIGTRYATGEKIPFWVKWGAYTVDNINRDRARIKEIWSWVYLKDLKK